MWHKFAILSIPVHITDYTLHITFLINVTFYHFEPIVPDFYSLYLHTFFLMDLRRDNGSTMAIVYTYVGTCFFIIINCEIPM